MAVLVDDRNVDFRSALSDDGAGRRHGQSNRDNRNPNPHSDKRTRGSDPFSTVSGSQVPEVAADLWHLEPQNCGKRVRPLQNVGIVIFSPPLSADWCAQM